MEQPTTNTQPAPGAARQPVIKMFGVGTAGVNVLERLTTAGLSGVSFAAVNTNAQSLAASSASEKLQLETRRLRGIGTGSDPERGRALAEEHGAKLKSMCEGADIIFLVAGLGGGTGTGVTPVLTRLAKETGALVVGFAVLPFDCEGSRRQQLAADGLEEFKRAADAVITLPNQKLLKLIDESTSVLETFKISNDLLTDGIRGIWRLLTCPGLIELDFSEVCELMRNRHAESVFAVAEASGTNRARDAVEKLLAHPWLEGGEVLAASDAVLVSVLGGSDLSLADINRVMEPINDKAAGAQVLMGAALDSAFQDRVAVTLIACRKSERAEEPGQAPPPEGLDTQLLTREASGRPGSRFVPPAPSLPQEKMRQMLNRQGTPGARGRRPAQRMRQGTLPLEIVSKGRFDKSEPTIHRGEDLDVPTYIRRGVALN